MQNITFYVNAKETLGVCRDYANARTIAAPTLVLGVGCTLKMRLFAGNGTERYPLEQLQEIASWQWNMDADFDGQTAYKVVSVPGHILIQGVIENVDELEQRYTEVIIPIANMHTEELTEWLGSAEAKTGLHGELVGNDAQGNTVFILQVRNFTVRNRITSLGDPQEIDPTFLTAEQVRALVAAGVVFQFSEDGYAWHESQTDADVYLRFRSASDLSAVWSAAVKMPVAHIAGGGTGGGSSITVDSALSATSTNPVQNAVITKKINELSDAVNSLNTSLSGAEAALVELVTTAEGI